MYCLSEEGKGRDLPSQAQGFRPPSTLQRRADFLRVQQTGRRFRGNLLLLVLAESTSETPVGKATRVGLTISRKVGKAVVRNRVRRRLREILRAHPEALCSGYDHVFIAFPQAATACFQELEWEVLKALERARSWASLPAFSSA